MNALVKTLLLSSIPLLQSTVKNPKSVEEERELIQQVHDLTGQILAGIPAPKKKKGK